jgi:hypothetical protein
MKTKKLPPIPPDFLLRAKPKGHQFKQEASKGTDRHLKVTGAWFEKIRKWKKRFTRG